MPAFDPATAATPEELYAGVATDLVEKYAPEPDPLPSPDTYTPKAKRAQQLIYNWLMSTSGGTVSSESLSGLGSTSYDAKALSVARGIVRDTMPEYVVKTDVAIISSFPR